MRWPIAGCPLSRVAGAASLAVGERIDGVSQHRTAAVVMCLAQSACLAPTRRRRLRRAPHEPEDVSEFLARPNIAAYTERPRRQCRLSDGDAAAPV